MIMTSLASKKDTAGQRGSGSESPFMSATAWLFLSRYPRVTLSLRSKNRKMVHPSFIHRRSLNFCLHPLAQNVAFWQPSEFRCQTHKRVELPLKSGNLSDVHMCMRDSGSAHPGSVPGHLHRVPPPTDIRQAFFFSSVRLPDALEAR